MPFRGCRSMYGSPNAASSPHCQMSRKSACHYRLGAVGFWMPCAYPSTACRMQARALFFQTDIKHEGSWTDKGALVVRAAEDAGAHVLFHKIICRRPAGTFSHGRPGYTHLIAVSRAMKCPDVLPMPDVITDAGPQLWVRAMGLRAAAHAVRFARDQVKASVVLDPFCGVGTVLAVANALGLDAIGVEKSRKRCERTRTASVRPAELNQKS